MPFDGLSLSPRSLSQKLINRGIQPIEQTVLTAHKTAQLNRYQPSWFYHHLVWVQQAIIAVEYVCTAACLVALGALLVAFICLLTPSSLFMAVDLNAVMSISDRLTWVVAPATMAGSIFFVALGLLLALERVEIKGGAAWHEYRFMVDRLDELAIPEPIRQVVERVVQTEASGRFDLIYGELLRETVLLDPYIGLFDCATMETVILGIWDGETVLHIAGDVSC